MKATQTCFKYFMVSLTMQALVSCSQPVVDMESNQKVRLAKLTIDSTQLEAYNALLKEEIEASMRLEPGVLTLFALAEKDNPTRITILEIYASEESYKSHLQTPHFKKYKTASADMVESLELIETDPLFPKMKIKESPEN